MNGPTEHHKNLLYVKLTNTQTLGWSRPAPPSLRQRLHHKEEREHLTLLQPARPSHLSKQLYNVAYGLTKPSKNINC